MALLGRLVLLEYDVGGPRLWHERIPLEHIREDLYVVVTPDRDIYAEELGLMNADLRNIRVRPGPGAVPPGVDPARIYGLPVWGANEMAAIRDEARRVAAVERGAAPVPAPVQPLAPVAAPQASEVVAVYPAGTLKWLYAEAAHGMKFGQEATGVVHAATRGAKAVQDLGAGNQIFVECVDGDDLQSFFQRPALSDKRVLAMKLNPMGQAERSLQDLAKDCVEQPVQWSLTGPRTAKWCVSYLSIEGLGFEGHHERVRQITKADASSWGIQEHFQISMTLRQALLVDQLDAYNLLSVEIQFRRLQTIEFSYSEKARDAESRAVGGRLSLEEQTVFGGVTRQFSTLMICPDLLTHVKSEVEAEASLAKNLRKAREEREQARKNNKKAGGGKGEDP